jgi:hypothetical protein
MRPGSEGRLSYSNSSPKRTRNLYEQNNGISAQTQIDSGTTGKELHQSSLGQAIGCRRLDQIKPGLCERSMGGAVANSKRVSPVVVLEAVAHVPVGFHHQLSSYSLLPRAQNLRLTGERTALNTVTMMYVLSNFQGWCINDHVYNHVWAHCWRSYGKGCTLRRAWRD